MDGQTLRASAVAGVGRVRRPVRAARALLEQDGDVLLVGAGAEADDRSAGVAHDRCARMARDGATPSDAAQQTVMQVLPAPGGSGGLIAVDAQGRPSLPFDAEGRYRGFARGADGPWTALVR